MSIETFLQEEHQKELLRFSTAGSVDDGKSTLIGRLLHDSKNIYEDHLAAIKEKSGSTDGEIDWALLTDGLKSEQEQGITIDVAYRYFSTPKRKFIIADTPGHEQYTRNMATGASTADLTVILIDARNGVRPQSKRHAFIASLLGIPHIIVAINKMDLVDYDQAVFERIKADFSDFAAKLNVKDIRFIPISALKGDLVVDRGDNMPWYRGESLMHLLDSIHIASDRNFVDARFPVQFVTRPHQDFRGYAGLMASGVLRTGDEVMVLPSMKTSRIASISTFDGPLSEAFPPMSVTLTLEDELDISRGDMIVHPGNRPHMGRHFEAMIVWMDESPLDPNRSYFLKHTSKTTQVSISKILYRVDINNLRQVDAGCLEVNEIGRLVFETHQPIFFDPYENNRSTGNFILVDAATNRTAGAGMIIARRPLDQLPAKMAVERQPSSSRRDHSGLVPLQSRMARLGQKPRVIWLTGIVSSGKSEIAVRLEQAIFERGGFATRLSGHNMRQGMSRALDFNPIDIAEHLRRVAETARILTDSGLIAICCFVSPSADLREQAKQIIGPDRFTEVFVDAPVAWCAERDETGLYQRAQEGEVAHLSGVTSPYEAPAAPDLHFRPDRISFPEAAREILALLERQDVFNP